MKKSIVLGIGGILGHDSNAALLIDGQIVASSQEERFTRIKHDAKFPYRAIDDCLRIAEIRPDQVESCVFAEKPLQGVVFDRTGAPSNPFTWRLARLVNDDYLAFPAAARKLLRNARFQYAWHHLSHAAAAFATSPFDRAVFLCVDGKGEDVNATIGTISEISSTIAAAMKWSIGTPRKKWKFWPLG